MRDRTFTFQGDHGLVRLLTERLADHTEYVGGVVKHPLERTVELRVMASNPAESVCEACKQLRQELKTCHANFLLEYERSETHGRA